jgi:hypothetical protein
LNQAKMRALPLILVIALPFVASLTAAAAALDPRQFETAKRISSLDTFDAAPTVPGSPVAFSAKPTFLPVGDADALTAAHHTIDANELPSQSIIARRADAAAGTPMPTLNPDTGGYRLPDPKDADGFTCRGAEYYRPMVEITCKRWDLVSERPFDFFEPDRMHTYMIYIPPIGVAYSDLGVLRWAARFMVLDSHYQPRREDNWGLGLEIRYVLRDTPKLNVDEATSAIKDAVKAIVCEPAVRASFLSDGCPLAN